MAPYIGIPDAQPNGNDGNTDQTKMLQIHCSGTPYEIGHKHGSLAKLQVSRTIAFYADMFQDVAKLDWNHVRNVAMEYEPVMRHKWPRYLEEIQGLADGAGVSLSDILACNVRTEIAFGLFSDGCTALSWLTPNNSWLAQNWDWMEAQKPNLIVLTISHQSAAPEVPAIKMVTEAGIIGKIGLNSAGVGVCLNAIKIKGVDPTKLPCHLGLRMVLESSSRDKAVAKLEEFGVASACHMLIADRHGGVGLEWSSIEVQKCSMNSPRQVFHSNHYLCDHPKTGQDTNWLADSQFRVKRIEELAGEVKGEVSREKLFGIFKDEKGYPGSICRTQTERSGSASLFNYHGFGGEEGGCDAWKAGRAGGACCAIFLGGLLV